MPSTKSDASMVALPYRWAVCNPAIPAISLEVCVGSEEQFRRTYVAPERSETLTLNGLDVVREEQGSDDDFRQIRYVFQDPKNPEVRVVLIDNFGGFSSRAADNPDVVERISIILVTFEFTG